MSFDTTAYVDLVREFIILVTNDCPEYLKGMLLACSLEWQIACIRYHFRPLHIQIFIDYISIYITPVAHQKTVDKLPVLKGHVMKT
jgi:hypothetical protein